MRILRTGPLIAVLSTIPLPAVSDSNVDFECQTRERVGIDNMLEIIGVIDELVIDSRRCLARRMDKIHEKLDEDYLQISAGDSVFRENFPDEDLALKPRPPQTSGQLSTVGAFREINNDDSRPKMPVLRGYSNITAQEE